MTIKSHPESPGSSVRRQQLTKIFEVLYLFAISTFREIILDAMEARAVAAVIVVCFAVCATVAVTSARSAEDDASPSRQDEGRSLDGEIRWLKEKTAEVYFSISSIRLLIN